MSKIHFPSCYDMEVEKRGITFTEPTRTKQDYKEECDINTIMRKYEATGIVSHVSAMQPFYADVLEYGDLQDAYAIMDKAQQAFDALPASLRQELDNDPRNLVGYISNPANKEKCIEYGIFNRPVMESSQTRIIDTGSNNDSGNVS